MGKVSGMMERVFYVIGFCLFILALTLPFFLHPDPAGFGTHRQLGLPACPLLNYLKIPCLSCGLTTSFSHLTHAQWKAAFQAHFFGPFIYVSTLFGAGLFFLGIKNPEKVSHFFLLKPVNLVINLFIGLFLTYGALRAALIWIKL